MTTEQQQALEAIRARWDDMYSPIKGYKEPYYTAWNDVDTLLQIIDAQQAAIDAVREDLQAILYLSSGLQHARNIAQAALDKLDSKASDSEANRRAGQGQ